MYSSRNLYRHNAENTHNNKRLDTQYFDQEFCRRVRMDFKRYLFVGVKRDTENIYEVIGFASGLLGYEQHKTAAYRADDGDRICHLYIKFRTFVETIEARDIFRRQDRFHAEIVDDILKGWFNYEMMCGKPGERTLGVLDIQGTAKFSDPLTVPIASNILEKFGNPVISPLSDTSVRVSFSSMAEAIAACIENGEWFLRSTRLTHTFYYRVLLDKSDRCLNIISMCNRAAKTADIYRLDYFAPCDPELPKCAHNTVHGAQYPAFNGQRGKPSRGRNNYRQHERNFKPRTYGYYNQNDPTLAPLIIVHPKRKHVQNNVAQRNPGLNTVNSG